MPRIEREQNVKQDLTFKSPNLSIMDGQDKTLDMHSVHFKQFMLKLIVKVLCKFVAKTGSFCQVLHLNTPMKMNF